jgi:tRNA-specific 2-thiouridylase
VLCNAEIKFKAFLDNAMARGAERIATGHYARVRTVADAQGSRVQLLKGLDSAKDQSYFLHRLNQSQLARTLFPVGELRKPAVRQLAEEARLPNARKRDSTGICFIGERPFREFLQRYLRNEPGPMRDDRGRLLGQHLGLSFYTLGQRQGLGIGGTSSGGGSHAPWYVARKELDSNTLRVVQGQEHPWLWSHGLVADQLSWVAGAPPSSGEGRLAAKTRYRQPDAACAWSVDDTSGHLTLVFDAAQWAVTPGQSAVLYDGEVCLGGGLIAADTGRVTAAAAS